MLVLEFEYANCKRNGRLAGTHCPAPSRGQVAPPDQGNPGPDEQHHARRRPQGRAAAGVDPPPQTPRTRCGRRARELRAQGLDSRRSPQLSAWPRVRSRCGCATWPARPGSVTRKAGDGRLRESAATGRLSARYSEARRAAARAAAAAEIGNLAERELIIAGAIAYWCEGRKNKPGRRADRVVFINSDPALIRFFLRFLEASRDLIERCHFPRVHPRKRRRGIGSAVLAGRYRGARLTSSRPRR